MVAVFALDIVACLLVCVPLEGLLRWLDIYEHLYDSYVYQDFIVPPLFLFATRGESRLVIVSLFFRHRRVKVVY